MTIKNIYKSLTAAFVLLMLASCIISERSYGPQSYGFIPVAITDELPRSTRADGDWLKTVRLIVFTDMASSPKVEINEVYTAVQFEMSADPEDEYTTAKMLLKVARRASGSNDKLVVAIVNEPDNTQLKEKLSGVQTPQGLAAVELDMGLFVADNHLSLKTNADIPMTGAVWTNKVYTTKEEAAQEGKTEAFKVYRAIAAVEVFLRNGTDVDPNLKLMADTEIKLINTYNKSPFVVHSQGINTLGQIQTVDTEDLIPFKSWKLTSGEQALSATQPVCVFYTPERTNTADRLTVAVSAKTSEGATRTGTLVLTKAKAKTTQIESPIDLIKRNEVYQIFVTINANGLSAGVGSWNDESIKTDF